MPQADNLAVAMLQVLIEAKKGFKKMLDAGLDPAALHEGAVAQSSTATNRFNDLKSAATELKRHNFNKLASSILWRQD